MKQFSKKKATKNSFLGVAMSVIPTAITWAVSRNWLTPADAAMVSGVVATVFSAFGANLAAFKGF